MKRYLMVVAVAFGIVTGVTVHKNNEFRHEIEFLSTHNHLIDGNLKEAQKRYADSVMDLNNLKRKYNSSQYELRKLRKKYEEDLSKCRGNAKPGVKPTDPGGSGS